MEEIRNTSSSVNQIRSKEILVNADTHVATLLESSLSRELIAFNEAKPVAGNRAVSISGSRSNLAS